MTDKEDAFGRIRLVVADVDGTLVTPDKVLTPRSMAAVRAIVASGMAFTITSGRPPAGMKALIDQLQLVHPITAFNGGLIVHPDLSIIREHLVPEDAAKTVIDVVAGDKVDVWGDGEKDWYVRSASAPHVDREQRTVQFPPKIVATFTGLLNRVVKIVAVSDATDTMARVAKDVRQRVGPRVSAELSQPYYLDVTHPNANKGDAVEALAGMMNVPIAQIATIGDMPNDVLMFQRSGVSIAMGNASADVQRSATFVTTTNAEEGFALAMERLLEHIDGRGTAGSPHGS